MKREFFGIRGLKLLRDLKILRYPGGLEQLTDIRDSASILLGMRFAIRSLGLAFHGFAFFMQFF